MRPIIAVVLSVVLFTGSVPLASGGPGDTAQAKDDWNRVTALPAGQTVKVNLQRGLGKSVTGSIVSISDTSLRVSVRNRWTGKSSKDTEIPREQVRRIYVFKAKTSRSGGAVGTVITWVLIGLVPAILLVAHSEEAVEKMAVVVIAVIVIAGTYGIVNAIRNTTSKGSLVYEAAERA